MKTRIGFVSNSSSASFVLKMHGLSKKQFNMVLNHTTFAKKLLRESQDSDERPNFGYLDDTYNEWILEIDYEKDEICGRTMMSNFDMEEFLKYIGVDMNDVEFTY